MAVLATFQTVGAFFGLVSAVVGGWLFVTKGYPSAIVVGAPLGGFGRRSAYLRVSNPGKRPILLTLKGGMFPDRFTIWPDHETKSALYGVIDSETILVLDPEETRLLPLIEPQNFDGMSDHQTIQFRLAWRYAQPGFLRMALPITGRLSKKDYRSLVAGTLRGSDDEDG